MLIIYLCKVPPKTYELNVDIISYWWIGDISLFIDGIDFLGPFGGNLDSGGAEPTENGWLEKERSS